MSQLGLQHIHSLAKSTPEVCFMEKTSTYKYSKYTIDKVHVVYKYTNSILLKKKFKRFKIT